MPAVEMKRYTAEAAVMNGPVRNAAPMDTLNLTPEDLRTLQHRLEVRERQINAVHEISAALFSKSDLDSLLRETLRVSLDAVEADAGSILLYDRERRKLVFRYVIGKTELLGIEIDPETDVTGKAAAVFRTGVSLLTTNAQLEGHNRTFDEGTGYRTENMLTVPLKNLGGEPIGVMQSLNKRGESFDGNDQELLEIVSSLAATSIVNASLAEEAQLAAVARAVGDLGHDIKNALTPIETMVETTIEAFIVPMYEDVDRLTGEGDKAGGQTDALLEAVQPLRDWYPEALTSVKDGCGDIREMVSEIADYIKGTQATNMEIHSVGEVIAERLRRLEVLARNRRITITMEALDSVPPFRFDRRLLGRAIFNLVNNALGAISDAVKKGTLEYRPFHVTVRARVVEGAGGGSGYCRIEVQDDGPGVPERVKQSLFTAGAISTTPGGTGIGTRFVKSVADAHNGAVGVESEPGQGACFWLQLPLAP